MMSAVTQTPGLLKVSDSTATQKFVEQLKTAAPPTANPDAAGRQTGPHPLGLKTLISCELCEKPGGELLWQDERCRVVLPLEPDHPGLCRIIWRQHVAEMTDLAPDDRAHCMRVVWAVEKVLRTELRPDKINLASLGNFVPHVHWHVIPRFRDDPHFPQPIWATRQRDSPAVRSTVTAERLRESLRLLLN